MNITVLQALGLIALVALIAIARVHGVNTVNLREAWMSWGRQANLTDVVKATFFLSLAFNVIVNVGAVADKAMHAMSWVALFATAAATSVAIFASRGESRRTSSDTGKTRISWQPLNMPVEARALLFMLLLIATFVPSMYNLRGDAGLGSNPPTTAETRAR